MGLAASQARLLFITARQNDVSAKMQRISTETMVLARESEDALNEYERIYSGGSTTKYSFANAQAVSYDELMGDAAKNSGNALFVTSGNSVVLTKALANSLGLDSSKNGKLSANMTPAMLAKQAGETDAVTNAINVISGSYKSGEYYSDTKISVSDLLSKLNKGTQEAHEDISFWGKTGSTVYYDAYIGGGCSTSFNGAFDGMLDNPNSGGAGLYSEGFNRLCANASNVNIYNNKNNGGIYGYFAANNETGNFQNASNNDWQNGRLVGIAKKSYSVSELYSLAGQQAGMVMLGSATGVNGVKDNLLNLTATIGNSIIAGLVNNYGLNESAVTSEVAAIQNSLVSSYISNAIDTKEEVLAQLAPKANDYYGSDSGLKVVDDNAQKYNENAIAVGMTMGRAEHCVVGFKDYGEHDSGSGLTHYVVSAANLVKDMLDQLVLKLTGNAVAPNKSETPSLNTGAKEDAVDKNQTANILDKYVTGDTKSNTTEVSGSDRAKAQYYIDLCEKLKGGYIIDDSIKDSSTLSSKLTNGTYFINGKHASNSLDMIAETNTGKERAELYKETVMKKIKNREDKLNKDLQKLQTEYTSLTTDYESVKSIITANIGRSYTYCQNG